MRTAASAALLLVCLAAAAVSAEAARPNILLLMAEDLSPRLGAYGDALAHTPNLDRLAAEGTRFTRAFTTAGVCAPSRAAIALGVHQERWGAGHMRAAAGGYVAVPQPSWKAFPELLRAAGYYTVNNGKTDYQMSTTLGGAFGGPFTIWDEERDDDWRGRAPGQPFFAYLTFGETHESQVWPTWRITSWVQLLLAPMRIAAHVRWVVETDPARVRVPPYYPDTPLVRADLAHHYNNIAAMDAAVGEVLAKLAEDGEAANTLVVFSSDHGDGLPRAKRWLYDSGIRVPLVVRWPGHVAAGGVNEELVSSLDYAATFLAVAGAARPAQFEGRVLVGPAREPPPACVVAARDRMDEQPDTVRAVRDEHFTYIRNFFPERPYVAPLAFQDQMPTMQELHRLHEEGRLNPAQSLWFRATRDPEELYDTRGDPDALRNLAGDPAQLATLARLREALAAWSRAGPDLGRLPERELAARFWPGGQQPLTESPTLTLTPQAGGARVAVASETHGASLGVRLDGGAWRLYTAPLVVASGSRVEAKAVRYGWAESDVSEAEIP